MHLRCAKKNHITNNDILKRHIFHAIKNWHFDIALYGVRLYVVKSLFCSSGLQRTRNKVVPWKTQGSDKDNTANLVLSFGHIDFLITLSRWNVCAVLKGWDKERLKQLSFLETTKKLKLEEYFWKKNMKLSIFECRRVKRISIILQRSYRIHI